MTDVPPSNNENYQVLSSLSRDCVVMSFWGVSPCPPAGREESLFSNLLTLWDSSRSLPWVKKRDPSLHSGWHMAKGSEWQTWHFPHYDTVSNGGGLRWGWPFDRLRVIMVSLSNHPPHPSAYRQAGSPSPLRARGSSGPEAARGEGIIGLFG